ncbi:hypothetical protein [Streptomyces hyaluromycini]|uniref:hypothetical protein n=1 Tax=Streptomyces hyaluromycini TaxID=1377993 RepID=UPI000B5CE4F3|nr:hypothetical protein [Streptomyces hyaluromycini]
MRRNVLRLAGNVCLLTAALGLTVPVTAGTATATATTAEPTRTVRATAAALPQFKSVRLPISGTFTGPSESISGTGTADVTVITLPNAAYNGAVPAGGSAGFGFGGAPGGGGVPTVTCTAT